MSTTHQPPPLATVTNVRRWAYALLTWPAAFDAFRLRTVPAPYMLRMRSSRSAVRGLPSSNSVLGQAALVEFSEPGHMGPATDADTQNAVIARFL